MYKQLALLAFFITAHSAQLSCAAPQEHNLLRDKEGMARLRRKVFGRANPHDRHTQPPDGESVMQGRFPMEIYNLIALFVYPRTFSQPTDFPIFTASMNNCHLDKHTATHKSDDGRLLVARSKEGEDLLL